MEIRDREYGFAQEAIWLVAVIYSKGDICCNQIQISSFRSQSSTRPRNRDIEKGDGFLLFEEIVYMERDCRKREREEKRKGE